MTVIEEKWKRKDKYEDTNRNERCEGTVCLDE